MFIYGGGDHVAEEPKLKAALQTGVHIAGEPFRSSIVYGEDGLCLGAGWENENHHKLSLSGVTESLSLDLPEFLNWEMELRRAGVLYKAGKQEILMEISTAENRRLLFAAKIKEGIYSLRLYPEIYCRLHNLPVMGKYLGEQDLIKVRYMQASYQKEGGFRGQCLIEASFSGSGYKFGDEDVKLPQQDIEEHKSLSPAEEKKSGVHWMELNKKIGPCIVKKIGGAFQDGTIRVCVDAGLTISVLTLDFMELSLGIKPGPKFDFQFGLRGMAVTVKKPPLMISGGLYVAEPGRLYNGEVTVAFEKFTFLALGSYGLTEQTDKPSFFIYLMLDYAFGGPPCFYITGLCAGFGLNRKINIPPLSGVKDFPFVAAARGTSKTLKPGTGASEALNTLSDHIKPCEGMNFLTAGIKFTSFGIVESVVIVNVEFGTKFELSLLGTSEISLPPKCSDPVVYGCLNLRAVFSPGDGILLIEGAMSNDSYLFCRDARLTGGFAFYSWFKGEYAGNFVLSVGGYHPQFQRGHYPAVDRVGLNWKISDHLELIGEAYFALTPNCLMAGGKLELNYHIGKLAAWCHAYADFLIQWKPFHYDISIGVSVGASYRLDLLFIHKTFKIELGADLHLWGPEFSGTAHIKWFIISFTIKFNTGSPNQPPRLNWKQFYTEFLPDFSGGIKGEVSSSDISEKSKEPLKLARMNPQGGYLGEREKGGLKYHYINARQFQMEIESALPVVSVQVNKMGEQLKDPGYGIYPMGITGLHASLDVHLYGYHADGTMSETAVNYRPVCKNVPRALWNSRQPDMNQDMIKDACMGLSVWGGEKTGHFIPPDKEGRPAWYRLAQLLKNEEYRCPEHFIWEKTKIIEGKDFTGEEMEDSIAKNDKRSEWLLELNEFGVRAEDQIHMDHFAAHFKEVFSAPVEMRSTGCRRDKN